MVTKSDDISEVGTHVFERSGLGKAPFKFIGMHTCTYQACHGAPIQAGSSCDHCGTGIMYVCTIRDSLGKTFKVGSSCVLKTGDAGMIRAYKNSPDVRKTNRMKAQAKDERVKTEWAALWNDSEKVAKLNAHRIPHWNGSGTRPWPEYAHNSYAYSGASGRAKLLTMAKKILKD